eukprot:81988-Chlamydomonas_euryale.AAC.4
MQCACMLHVHAVRMHAPCPCTANVCNIPMHMDVAHACTCHVHAVRMHVSRPHGAHACICMQAAAMHVPCTSMQMRTWHAYRSPSPGLSAMPVIHRGSSRQPMPRGHCPTRITSPLLVSHSTQRPMRLHATTTLGGSGRDAAVARQPRQHAAADASSRRPAVAHPAKAANTLRSRSGFCRTASTAASAADAVVGRLAAAPSLLPLPPTGRPAARLDAVATCSGADVTRLDDEDVSAGAAVLPCRAHGWASASASAVAVARDVSGTVAVKAVVAVQFRGRPSPRPSQPRTGSIAVQRRQVAALGFPCAVAERPRQRAGAPERAQLLRRRHDQCSLDDGGGREVLPPGSTSVEPSSK